MTRQKKPKKFFPETQQKPIILSYLCGLGAALILATGVIAEAGGAATKTVATLFLLGLLLLIPALLASTFWRMAATLVGIALGVKFSLQIRFAVEHYGMIKHVFETNSEELRYGVFDVAKPLISAMLCVIFASLVSYPDIKRASRFRKFPIVVNGFVTIALCLAAWFLVNYIAIRRYKTFDMTDSQLYTISEESKGYLANIEQPLKMHIFLPEGTANYTLIRQLSEHYVEAAKGRITRVFHDFLKDRQDFEAEFDRLELLGTDLSDFQCVVFEAGHRERNDKGEVEWVKDRMKQISISRLFRTQLSGPNPSLTPRFVGEEAFTNAILELQQDEKPRVYFLQGHGELGLDNPSLQRGMSKLYQWLQRRFLKLKALNLTENPKIPDDCACLVIAGALGPLTETELTMIDDYLDRGGRLLSYLEVLRGGQDGLRRASLTPVLEPYGIRPSHHFVVKKLTQRLNGRLVQSLNYDDVPFRLKNSDHPIVQPLQNGLVYSTKARALIKIENQGPAKTLKNPKETLKTSVLLPAGEDSFAIYRPRAFARQQRLTKNDLTSGFELGLAAEYQNPETTRITRLVAFGDSDMIANEHLTKGQNLELFLNSLNWLLQRENQFIAKAKKPPSFKLEMTRQTKLALQLTALFLLPVLPLSMAMLTFLLRRQ